MERVDLQAQERVVLGKQVKRLRTDGWIPGVVIGPDNPSLSIKMEERQLIRTLQEAGSTTLINLSVGEGAEPKLVLAREIQSDILTGKLLHVDFYEVRLTEKVRTSPSLDFIGEAPVLESGEAVVIYGMNEVEVECLPTDLVSSIEVDISVLKTLDDSILVGDLPVPEGITIVSDPGEVVASAVSTRELVIEEEEEEVVEIEFEEGMEPEEGEVLEEAEPEEE